MKIIKNTPPSKIGPDGKPLAAPEIFRIEYSTLDPYQYPGYFSVDKDEVIVLQSTWRCKGRTSDFKEHCPNPRPPAPPPTLAAPPPAP
ncbi:MAG: hypothetical protein ACOYOK_10485 [Pseudobdellovibrionaceae bacterium]